MTFNGKDVKPGDVLDIGDYKFPNVLESMGYIKKVKDTPGVPGNAPTGASQPPSNDLETSRDEKLPSKTAVNVGKQEAVAQELRGSKVVDGKVVAVSTPKVGNKQVKGGK